MVLCAVSVCLLNACPGEIENKARFYAWMERYSGQEVVVVHPSEKPPDGGTLDDPTNHCEPVAFLRTTCALADCHGATDPKGGLDLATDGVAGRLRGAPSTLCTGRFLVEVGNPLAGVFWQKINGTPLCGSPMPFGKPPLGAAQKECLRNWLQTTVGSP